MSIYNSAEYHFAQTDTDRDVDKQKETESDDQGRGGRWGMSSWQMGLGNFQPPKLLQYDNDYTRALKINK